MQQPTGCVKPDRVTTCRSVPVVITGCPWQTCRQRTKQVVKSQCDNDVIINAYKTVEYTVTKAHTYKCKRHQTAWHTTATYCNTNSRKIHRIPHRPKCNIYGHNTMFNYLNINTGTYKYNLYHRCMSQYCTSLSGASTGTFAMLGYQSLNTTDTYINTKDNVCQ